MTPLRVLANPVRLRVVAALHELGKLCVCDASWVCGTSDFPTAPRRPVAGAQQFGRFSVPSNLGTGRSFKGSNNGGYEHEHGVFSRGVMHEHLRRSPAVRGSGHEGYPGPHHINGHLYRCPYEVHRSPVGYVYTRENDRPNHPLDPARVADAQAHAVYSDYTAREMQVCFPSGQTRSECRSRRPSLAPESSASTTSRRRSERRTTALTTWVQAQER